MKKIMFIFIILGSLLGQDVLITKGGIKYTGKYERTTEDRVYFTEDGKQFASGVDKAMIDIVILDDGTVVYSAGEVTQEKLDKAGIALDEVKVIQTESDNRINANLELRQTIALEKIAFSTNGIFYLMVAGTVVAILTYIKYLDEMNELEQALG